MFSKMRLNHTILRTAFRHMPLKLIYPITDLNRRSIVAHSQNINNKEIAEKS